MATKAAPEKQDADKKPVQARGPFKRMHTTVGLRVSAAEATRLREDKERTSNWKRWGPFLSERQWATVREDYSPDGSWYEIANPTIVWTAGCAARNSTTLASLITS